MRRQWALVLMSLFPGGRVRLVSSSFTRGCHVARLSLFSMPAGHDARTPAGRNAETSRDRERTAPPLEVRADHPTPNITAVHPPSPRAQHLE